MIIEPRTRGFICLTAHPVGCAQNIENQIEYVTSKGKIDGAKKVLVIGSSTGFGLASRITSAFGSDAATIGVFFDKPASPNRPASPGFYNTAAFETAAHKAGLYAKSINGDAFSNEIKEQVVNLIKQDLGQVDLIIYSLASPVRTHPVSGKRFKSVLKPIGENFTNKTVDFHTGKVSEISINPAEGADIENTVTVMGGEDWKMWMDALQEANVLAEGVKTVAYSYIGPEVTKPVYRNGTIGAAKDDLEAKAFTITEALKKINQASKPLAIYIFGGNKKIHDHISKVTSSGTVCINDVMLPVLIPNLPFGGVGKSGMGKFHGEEGFKNFSNQKSITYKGFLFDLNLRYPPYDKVMKIIKFIFKI